LDLLAMAKRGAPLGNKNGAITKKPWADAIQRALELHRPADQRVRLDALAKSLIAKAMDGDMAALKEIGDRVDGKSMQQIELSQDPENPVFSKIDASMPQHEAARIYKDTLKSITH
jgi:hypothetical protein